MFYIKKSSAKNVQQYFSCFEEPINFWFQKFFVTHFTLKNEIILLYEEFQKLQKKYSHWRKILKNLRAVTSTDRTY